MRSSLLLLAFLLAAAPAAADLLDEVAPGTDPPGVAGVMWSIAADDSFATSFLDRVDERHLALSDTILSVLRFSEPGVRALLPDLYVIRDFGRAPEERPPDWAHVRWAGVRWMRRIVEFGPSGRDQRLRDDLDRAMARVGRPQRAEMGGLVEILVEWWADRGLDPALTHHRPPRDPAATAMTTAHRLPDLQHPYPGLDLLRAMDRDPVVRERVLSRLHPDSTAFLARDFMLVVQLDADSLYALGVPPRTWDAQAQVSRGHAVPTLRALALDALDQCTPPVVSGPDDLTRRLARRNWWDDARFEARYWSDPRQAPDFSVFLLGLRRSPDDGGRDLMRWVRLVYLQSAKTQQRILERFGERQHPVVAELMGLSALDRDEAAAAGFRMVYTRRPLSAAEGDREVAVAIDFEQVRDLVYRMLAAITGARPPAVLAGAPEARAAWWRDWWAAEREDSRWYRGPLPAELELPTSRAELELQPRRGRVD